MTLKEPIINSPLNKTRIDKWVFLFSIPMAMRKLDLPNIQQKGNIDTNSVQFSLTKVKVPDEIVKAISQRYGSGNLHVSSHSREPYDALEIEFNIDNMFSNYMVISEWLNLLHDEKLAIPDPNDVLGEDLNLQEYWTNLGIVGLDEYNVARIQFIFTQAFPTKLSGWEYDYTNVDEIPCKASFAFSQKHTTYPNKEVLS